jgi:Fe-S cluster assembly iron-binding protein IscA
MNYAKGEDVASKKDEAVLANGITVLVDPKAVFYIAGTVMDFEVSLNRCIIYVCLELSSHRLLCRYRYMCVLFTYVLAAAIDLVSLFNFRPLQETELSAEFTFKNPNSKGSCGCGESFNV